jgi:DNA polymerase-1
MEIEGVLLDNNAWSKLKETAEIESKIFEESIIDYILEKLPELNKKNCLEYCEAIKIPAKTKKLRNELESITDLSNINSWIRKQINIGSHTQMLAVLRDLEKIDIESTSEKIIKDHKNESKLVELLLTYREHQKKLTTYGENFLELINPVTGRIHVDQNQVGTATGRFAVSRLHQIPRDNRYRNAFIARPGYKIITADLDQAEFRLIGADSGEPEIIEAYKRGYDFHRKTASVIYKKDYDVINKDERYWGKQANFALVYRVSEYGLYYNFGLPLDEGRQLLTNLFSGYKRLKIYMDYLGEKVWEMGYCPTMLGRRRYFEKSTLFTDTKEYYKFKNRTIRELGNHRIQGTCADIIKIAMLNLFKNNPYGRENFRILIQLHDELVVEAREDLANDAKEFMEYTMLEAERPYLGEIPPAISISVKDYWSKD